MRGKCWPGWVSKGGLGTTLGFSAHQPEFLHWFCASAGYLRWLHGIDLWGCWADLLMLSSQIHSFPVSVLWQIIFRDHVFVRVFPIKDMQDNSIHILPTQVFNYKACGKVLYCQMLTLGSQFPLQIYTWFSNKTGLLWVSCWKPLAW